jgi:excisionase family DNA binding protein
VRKALPRLAYTIAEAAEITALSKAHLYRLMERGQLGFAQLGATRRIPVTELVRLGLTASDDNIPATNTNNTENAV